MTAAIFTLQVLVALPAAYALAKLRFGLAKPLFALVLLGLLIPGHVPAIPHYIMLSHAGLLNTYPALVLPSIISVFGIFWIRQFFRTVPDDLIHAARLDGLSEFSIVWRIMLPAAMPALVAFGILSVVFHWNDYFWPLLVVTSPDMAMPALGTVYLRNDRSRHRLRPADGRDRDHHCAAGGRLSLRAAALHRGHDAHRPERLTTGGLPMKRRTLLAGGVAAASLAAPALRAQSPTEIKVLYSAPDLFKTLHEQIAAEFMKANPQYKITFLAPLPAYEEARKRPCAPPSPTPCPMSPIRASTGNASSSTAVWPSRSTR